MGITGANTSGEAVDPTYAQSDINTAGATHDFPLYRVQFEGLDIVALTPLFETEKPLREEIKTQKRTATLMASNWSSSAPYTQSITVEGLSDGVNARAYPQWPEALADKLALGEETVKVRSCERSGSTMTFQCWEDKPVLDIPIIVEVYV